MIDPTWGGGCARRWRAASLRCRTGQNLVAILLVALGCSKAEPPPSVAQPDSTVWGFSGLTAVCLGGKLVVSGRYHLKGGKGEMILTTDGQDRARMPVAEGSSVPFKLECEAPSSGTVRWELFYDGTAFHIREDGTREDLSGRRNLYSGAVSCNEAQP